jgi:hypothetical protein
MNKVNYFKIYLRFFGTLNVLTAFSIPLLFGNQLLWHPRNLPTELMVGSLYFALGIVMLLVSKTPMKHKAFIDFIIIFVKSAPANRRPNRTPSATGPARKHF